MERAWAVFESELQLRTRVIAALKDQNKRLLRDCAAQFDETLPLPLRPYMPVPDMIVLSPDGNHVVFHGASHDSKMVADHFSREWAEETHYLHLKTAVVGGYHQVDRAAHSLMEAVEKSPLKKWVLQEFARLELEDGIESEVEGGMRLVSAALRAFAVAESVIRDASLIAVTNPGTPAITNPATSLKMHMGPDFAQRCRTLRFKELVEAPGLQREGRRKAPKGPRRSPRLTERARESRRRVSSPDLKGYEIARSQQPIMWNGKTAWPDSSSNYDDSSRFSSPLFHNFRFEPSPRSARRRRRSSDSSGCSPMSSLRRAVKRGLRITPDETTADIQASPDSFDLPVRESMDTNEDMIDV
ncbi:hypothetical protein V8F20_011428 [Naviculisporaceae sp. PSN 640]